MKKDVNKTDTELSCLQVKNDQLLQLTDWTHIAKALLMQNTVCCWSKCFVCTNILNWHLPLSERQHWSNNSLVDQSCQFMANKMLKCRDIMYLSGDKFFHYSFHSKIVWQECKIPFTPVFPLIHTDQVFCPSYQSWEAVHCSADALCNWSLLQPTCRNRAAESFLIPFVSKIKRCQESQP